MFYSRRMHTLITCIMVMLIFLTNKIETQEFESPCPRLFVYEGKSSEPNRWYGIITLLSDTDLNGVWLRVAFDQPTLQLGNWFGEPKSRNEDKEYLIKNREFQLKAHTPKTVRFFVQYDPNKPIPKLVSFRLNARQLCPEGGEVEQTTETPKLQTSSPLGFTPAPPPTIFKPDNSMTTSNEEEVYPGDFSFLNRPESNPIGIGGNQDVECGTVVARPRPLITYGQSTQEGEFPWHAALYYAKGIDLTYICGASLISRNHVITVAHCVTRRRMKIPLNPNNLAVYLGKYYLKRFTGVGIQDQQVAKIIPHPEYNPETYGNDIAVLKFVSPTDITDYVRPVCLWQDSSELNSVINKNGNVVGWGFDETGKVTETLMQAKMPIVSHETCIFSYPDFYSRFTSETTYCAGFRNGTSVCNGDSGGGMVFPKSNSTKTNPVWQLRGLVSISVALQNQFKCDSSHFVVFTDAAKYLNWIKQSMLT